MGQTTLKVMVAVGVGIFLMALALAVIHVSIRTVAIIGGIGGVLVALYLIIDYRQSRPIATKDFCKCNVCDHKNELTCLDQRCPCCTIEKEGRVGHGVGTLT